MRKFNLTAKKLAAAAANAPRRMPEDMGAVNMMLDPRYLRQSSTLIQDALQKGFDVLQLANGDIVTTGTKTIIYQYSWDEAKGKLVKCKPESKKGKKDSGDSEDADEEISEIEEA